MFWILAACVVLAGVLRIIEKYFCWHCKKFSLKTTKYGPDFAPVAYPRLEQPDVVCDLWRTVRVCTCCNRSRMLAPVLRLSSQERVDAYAAMISERNVNSK